MDLDPLAGPAKVPRKVKYKPKAPVKRVKKEVLPKVEKEEDDIDEAKAEYLLRRLHETSSGRPKPEKKAQLAQVAFGVGEASTFKSYHPSNGTSSDGIPKVGKEYKEPWNYYSNYPVTLPVRRPYAGNPEILDKEEFDGDEGTAVPEENATNAAKELGLLDKSLENNMFFLQLPKMLPGIAQSADSEVPEHQNNGSPSRGEVISQNLTTLDSLPQGLIGKMLVYKSGAVKMRIGNAIYNVTAGMKCMFSQDIVAINAEKKLCCNLGELNKRAVATLDVDSMLQGCFRK
ncbi:uncharacterized protein LOC121800009 isoform X1 [Salvia splendens]|uniref:uncharacterized protein LOC121800009 isoform X1 n=2 Tax=Salvia splendens TaxID=180675 RepID=UPI001C2557E6|nr:uncharacterized protein LOC121800009 isoform X1 [Salvia splendens]